MGEVEGSLSTEKVLSKAAITFAFVVVNKIVGVHRLAVKTESLLCALAKTYLLLYSCTYYQAETLAFLFPAFFY